VILWKAAVERTPAVVVPRVLGLQHSPHTSAPLLGVNPALPSRPGPRVSSLRGSASGGGGSTVLHRDSVLAGLRPVPAVSAGSEAGLAPKGWCRGAREGFSPAGLGQTPLLRGRSTLKAAQRSGTWAGGKQGRQPPPPAPSKLRKQAHKPRARALMAELGRDAGSRRDVLATGPSSPGAGRTSSPWQRQAPARS